MAWKSLCLTYFFWFVGGWFGLHHLYLGRDRHAFLIWSTAGGYWGFGWFRDFLKIPTYVRDANEDPEYMETLIQLMRKKKRPPYSFFRQAGQVVAGNFWGWALELAVPQEEIFGYSFKWLHLLIPFAIALGVHAAGNVGRVRGSFIWALFGAYSWVPLRLYGSDTISIAAFISSTVFEAKALEWRRTPRKPHSFLRRFTVLGACFLLYCNLWFAFMYFNLEVTDSSGETIKFRDAVDNFLTSPLWKDFLQTLKNVFSKWWHQGWKESWKLLMNELDPHGERQALTVLGLDEGATQEEITAHWRKLSREWHPDRYLDPAKKLEAQEKFMEFNAAYENLSQMKARRSKRNRSFQDF